MKKIYLTSITCCILLFSFIFPSLSHADARFSEDKSVLQFLHDAFQAQVSLSEQFQSMEEIHNTLFPYFTEDFTREFLDENLVAENGKYITYGTDFPLYYIPFFSYTAETKVIRAQEHIYIYEFFPETDEGPVGYESHYEGIKLNKADGGWKVAEPLNHDVLTEIIKQTNGDTAPVKMDLVQKSMMKATLQLGLALNPIASFYKYGNSFIIGHFNK
ncbi:DUF3993 domain-containing protein [Cytobacillus praedii]|uniref:DUF3993 domain-containing protein n=1 Tax=Cytobacillus praedii TaxID=1742358 RepID=A0A4R1B186_9BACI|nr:DUF3993 domain-containing protein [Cytobacillus praedii]TCJ06163.1 DUF3993 domain-containing protein [Cytobacillus praedii]